MPSENPRTSPITRPGRLAKLTPPLAEGLAPRPRLFDRLDACRSTPMVWVSAPPGAGKTSLVASYLLARHLPTLWMQVDAADADPATFFHYLGLAARALAEDATPLPVFTPDDAERPERFARRFFRELFDRLPERTAIVFDNAQEAGAHSMLAPLLAILIEEQPAGFQLIVVSRNDPPAELSRARATRQLAFIEWEELRFRADEAQDIAAVSGVPASEAVDRVLEQSQGWAAGIVLMLERVRQSGDIEPGAFAGGREAVFEYFAAQVFNASSASVRTALLQLSYLPRMPIEMARDITGDGEIGALLDDLARRHLFTDRRFEPALTYQFHALFREFLQAQAQRELGAAAHARQALTAARLLHAGGHDTEAFALYVRGAAWEDAARLVLDSAQRLVEAGRHQTLAEWIDAMPRGARAESPWLTYWLGVAKTGLDRSASRVELERALAQFDMTGDQAGQIRALAALLGTWWNESASVVWLEPYTRRLALLVEEATALDVQTLALGLTSLAPALLMIRPSDPTLHGHVKRLAALPVDELPPALALAAGTCVLHFYWGLGDSEACESAARRTRPLAERGDLPSAERMWFWFWLMTHHVYEGDAARARDAMSQARRLRDDSRRAPPFIDFVRWDVTLELQCGRIREARSLLESELEPHRPSASVFTQACIDLEFVRCAVEEHRFDEAIHRGNRALEICRESRHDWLQVVIGLSVCCAQALSGRIEDGFRTLDELRRLTTQALPIQAASVEAYEALLHLCAGDHALAHAALDRALTLRGGTTYVWGPGWNRPAIAALSAMALAAGRHVPTMQRFVRALLLAPPSIDAERWPWAVQLTVLDGFRLQLADDASSARRRKTAHRLMELLKALAAFGGEAVQADRLCDAVWPDADGDAARRSLDTSLSRLRQLLGHEEAVQMQAGKVSLNRRLVRLDLQVFAHRLAALAREAPATPEWVAKAESALALYRRPLLAEEPESPWLLGERDQWRRRWLALVRQLVGHYRVAGMPERAAGIIEAALSVDPECGRSALEAEVRTRRSSPDS